MIIVMACPACQEEHEVEAGSPYGGVEYCAECSRIGRAAQHYSEVVVPLARARKKAAAALLGEVPA